MNRKPIIILTILLAIALAGISFYGGSVTYVFLMLVVLVPLSCIIYIGLVIFSIRIYQKSDGRGMTASVPSDFYITLNNEGFFSFSYVRMIFYSSFSTITGLGDDVVYELPPHSSVTRKTGLVCRYRGEYLVGIKELEVKDFLGIFTIRYKIKEPLSVIVAPAMVELAELKTADDNEDFDRDSATDRTEPDISVREYVPGDNARLIHHKASAVMQKPMIRELTGGEKNGVLIVMESDRSGETTEEYLPVENRIIESTLALALYYIRNNIPVDVAYNTDEVNLEPVRTYADYERLYGTMSKYNFREEGSTAKLLDGLCYGAYPHTQREFILVFNDIDAARLDLIRQMNTSYVPVRVYIAKREPGSDRAYGDKDADCIFIGTKAPTEDVL